MNMETDITKVKVMNVGLSIQIILRLRKLLLTGICGYIIQLIRFQTRDIKHKWQKKHLENQTGTSNSFKPVKIKKEILKKNMKPGSKICLFILTYFISFSLFAEEK